MRKDRNLHWARHAVRRRVPVGQDVVAKRAGIADARFGKIGDQLGKVLSRGRAVTDGTDSERPLQRLEAAVDLLECLLQPVAIRHLVKKAVVTDLVSGRDYSLAGFGMGKRRPSGRVKNVAFIASSAISSTILAMPTRAS